MKIALFEDNLTEDDVKHLIPRKGVRAVLKHHDHYVLIYNRNWNLYTLPGGGIETNESELEALKREVKEETGFAIKNPIKTLTLKEHFYDSIWEHHYYLCETDGEAQAINHTKEERDAGMETQLKTTDEVLELFMNHQSDRLHADQIYQREFLGFMHSLKE